MKINQRKNFKISDVFLALIYCVIFDIIWIPIFFLAIRPLLVQVEIIPMTLLYPSLFLSFPLAVILPFFIKGKYDLKIRELGIRFTNLKGDLCIGLLSYVFVIILSVAIISAIWYIFGLSSFPITETTTHTFIKSSFGTKNALSMAMIIAILGIFSPVVEELYFRGYMYSAFKNRMSIKLAVVVSSFVFAILHIDVVFFPYYLIVGVVAAYIFEKRQSLIPSITLHSLNNFVAIIVLAVSK